MLTCLFLTLSLVGHALAVPEASAAAQRAIDYVLSQKDPTDGSWPIGERASAILALLSRTPRRYNNEILTDLGKVNLQLEIQSLGVEFLTLIRDIQSQGRPGSPLENVDDSTLLEMGAALNGMCADQRNFHGYNLVHEYLRRIRHQDTVLYGGFVLAVCNSKRGIALPQINRLNKIKPCPTCPFYVEEVSMNILAASCVAATSRRGSPRHNAVKQVIPTLVRHLVARQESDGGFGDFMATAMATQALVRAESDLIDKNDVARAIRRLLKDQKEDGSFGSSIGNTALAMPALTGQTLADLRTNSCPKLGKSTYTVSIVVSDELHSKQSFRFHLDVDVDENQNLGREIQRFSRSNPETFNLRLRRGPQGPIISKINQLSGHAGARWKVYEISPDGRRLDLGPTWGSTEITKDSRFEIVLSYN